MQDAVNYSDDIFILWRNKNNYMSFQGEERSHPIELDTGGIRQRQDKQK
jgi:hypothetical protein